MKKMAAGIATAALVFIVGATGTFASGQEWGGRFMNRNGDGYCAHSGITCQYRDEDGDGVCDNYAGRTGLGDGHGHGHGHGFHGGCHRK